MLPENNDGAGTAHVQLPCGGMQDKSRRNNSLKTPQCGAICRYTHS